MKKLSMSLLFVSILSAPVFVAALFGGDDEDEIWRSGLNLYFKYADQDNRRFGANDHPVALDEQRISLALKGLQFTEKSIFSGERLRPVFSASQANKLGKYLAIGLREAAPSQDIIFVIEGGRRKLVVLSEKAFIAGRVFYQDGLLNIILGNYDRVRNQAFESVYDPSGRGAVPYNFNHGRRGSESNEFDGVIEEFPGFSYKLVQGEKRGDWLRVDIDTAARAYQDRERGDEDKTTALKQGNAAELARQRREMRLEMARMRKQMQESGGRRSPEQRLKTLQDLLDKDLITAEEYDQRRQAVLDEI